MLDAQQTRKDVQRWFRSPVFCFDSSEAEEYPAIPATWKSLLDLEGKALSEAIGEMWECVNSQLPGVWTFLTTRIDGVCVVIDESEISLLYVYPEKEAGRRYYISWLPVGQHLPPKLQTVWNKVPLELQELYTTVHDGWIELNSYALGPLPTKLMSFLSDPEWDLEEGPEAELGFEWKNVLAVLNNGAGDHLCLDTGNLDLQGYASGFVFFHETPLKPERRFDFWSVLNAWMKIGFENAE